MVVVCFSHLRTLALERGSQAQEGLSLEEGKTTLSPTTSKSENDRREEKGEGDKKRNGDFGLEALLLRGFRQASIRLLCAAGAAGLNYKSRINLRLRSKTAQTREDGTKTLWQDSDHSCGFRGPFLAES